MDKYKLEPKEKFSEEIFGKTTCEVDASQSEMTVDQNSRWVSWYVILDANWIAEAKGDNDFVKMTS